MNFLRKLLGQVDVPVLLNRGVAIAGALTTGGTLAQIIPGHIGVLAVGVLGLIASTGPQILQAAGLVRPVSPGLPTAVQTGAQAIAAIVKAPAAARAQTEADAKADLTRLVTEAATSAVVDALNKTGSFKPSEMGAAVVKDTVQEVKQNAQTLFQDEAVRVVKLAEAETPSGPVVA